MRAVLQRVTQAEVSVEKETTGSIKDGLVVLLGVGIADSEEDAKWMAEKIVNLRIFEDEQGKMNHSLVDIKGEVLAISQFTLYGDCRKGRRPGFTEAAPPDLAKKLYERWIEEVKKWHIDVAEGIFQADMLVKIYNDGPVTMLLDSKKNF